MGRGNIFDRRISSLFIIFLVATIIAIVRLFILQTVEHGKYYALAFDQREVFRELAPARGEIKVLDPDGSYYPLALNRRYFILYAVPRDIEQPAEVARLLAPLLRDDPPSVEPSEEEGDETNIEVVPTIAEMEKRMEDSIYEKIIRDPDDPYEPLKQKVTEDQVEKIKNLNLAGIGWEETYLRAYPEDQLAAQVLGYVGYDDQGVRQGILGVERVYNDILTGQAGSLELEVGATGGWIPLGAREEIPAQDGAMIILSLDRAVQAVCEQELSATMDTWQAESGTVVVMEPTTGRILALATAPFFDPNKFNEVENAGDFRNRAISDLYEPGSIFKPFVVAAGIDQNLLSPDERFDDPGAVQVGNYEIRNSDDEGHGSPTVIEGIEKSLNVVLVQIAQKIGLDKIYPYYQSFAFGEKTDIDLPAESSRPLDPLSEWREIDLATSSFGQGKIFVTSMQLLKAYSAFVNDGKMVKPRLVDQIISADGERQVFETEFVGTPISARTAATMSGILVSSAKNGYAKAGAIPGYTLAAKTGTAQVANQNAAGYSNERITSFVGYFPAEDPKFLMLVSVKAPQGSERGTWGETVAAPIFKKVSQFLVTHYQIPPQL